MYIASLSRSRSPSKSLTRSTSNGVDFAHEMMLAEFGKLGHLRDGEWVEHDDIDPETLAKNRQRAIWGGSK